MSVVLRLNIDTNLGGATDEYFTDPVTSGARGIVQIFGAALPGQGLVELHWGDDIGGWDLIKAVAGGTYEYLMNEEYLGDGVKMFRVRRSKIGGGGPLAIKSWFKAIEN